MKIVILFLLIIPCQAYGLEISNSKNALNNITPRSTTDWILLGTSAGITSSIVGYFLVQFFQHYFSAQAYYYSAKKIRDNAQLKGIDTIQSFNQIILLLKDNRVRQWRKIAYSDCYVVDTYHFIQEQLRQLSIAQEYLIFARTKKDFDSALLYVIEQVESSINSLYNRYIHLRSICEEHPLFSRHMMIYHQRECIAGEQATSP